MVDISIAVLLGIITLATAYLGVHVTLHPTEEPRQKLKFKLGFIGCSLIACVLIGVQTYRNGETQHALQVKIENLPKTITATFEQYVKNTSPPPVSVTIPGDSRPAPPTGLVASVDGNIGASAAELNREVMDFLRVEGDPPRQKSGESAFDLVVRSNAWYADLMAKYNWQLKHRVITVVNTLVDNKAIDPRVAKLAKDPENISGIKVLSDQLEEGARRFGVYSTRSEDANTAPSKAAITQESQKPSAERTNSSDIEKALVAMNDQPVGTIALRLHEVVQGRPNIVRLRAGTKSFLFDPVSRIVVFRMMTSAGRSVDLRLPLKPTADRTYFIALVWDISKGARLQVNDKFTSTDYSCSQARCPPVGSKPSAGP